MAHVPTGCQSVVVLSRTHSVKSSSSFSCLLLWLSCEEEQGAAAGGGGHARLTMISVNGFVDTILCANFWAEAIISRSMAPREPA